MIKLTDQYFTYRNYPLDYDGAGKVYLKGNSIGWNQYVAISSTASQTVAGLTITNNNNGTYRISGTATDNNINFWINGNYAQTTKLFGLINGHKYIIKQCVLFSNTTRITDTPYLDADAYVYTATANTDITAVRMPYAINGRAYNLTVAPMVIDLTLLGDSHITDYSSFKTYYPLNYYTYTQGTLVNFNGTGIKTVGKNQLDSQEAVTGNYATLTKGTGTIREVYTNGTAIYIDISFFQTSPYANGHFLPKKYTLSFDIEGIPSGQRWTVGLRNTSNAFIQSTVISADGHYSKVLDFENVVDCYLSFCRTTGTSAFDITVSNLQLELGESETSYEDYKESTSDLPTLTYFPNGMKSAGSIYDEITGSKAITRVGSVDLGSLTWTRTTSYTNPFFYTSTPANCKYFYNDTTPNATSIYSVYQVKSASVFGQNAPNKSFTIYSYGNQLFVRDDSYTSASAFTSAMSGVYLNYELSSYSETEVSDDFIYLGYANGTEQLLPINGATPTTSPLFADIEYYTLMDSEIPYRKFWIINNSGEQWDLTEKDFKAFLNNPTGLGFKKTIEMTRYGEKAVKNNETYDFPSVQGELLFYDSANSNRYDKYNQFVRFVMDTPLKLYYQIPVSISSQIADIYSMDCEITQLDKTESKPDRLMRCNVTFSGLGFWEGDEVTISGSGLSYTIENKGDFPVGFEIAFEGNFSNPYFTLSQDGEIYGECKFDDSQNTFSNVYVNSNDGEQDIVLKQSGTILPNPLSYQDLSISNGNIYVTFVKLARGTTQLTIGAGTVQTNAEIKFTPAYRSV